MINQSTQERIEFLLTDLFEILNPLEQQRVLDRLTKVTHYYNPQITKKLSNKELILKMALGINRNTSRK